MRRIYLIICISLVAAALALPAPRHALARILEGDEYLRTQVESDFDRDGDVDFLDFTVFSAFYDEGV